MDPSSLNAFLDQFLAVADTGFGLIQGDVNYVLNALIVVSITLAGVQWALAGEAPVGLLFRKVLFIGLFAFLINNWNELATAINQSGAMLGLRAGGSGLTMAELHNPGRVGQIGIELFGRTVALSEGMNVLTDAVPMATIWLSAVFVMLGFFLLALQLFVSLIAFKLGSLAAFVALPWGVFNGTSWVAERPLGWVAGCAIRLFVLAFVASVSISFVNTLPATFTLNAGGVLNVFLFGLTVLSLAWFAPMLASEVVQGQPHLSGSDAVRTGVGATFTTVGAGFLLNQGRRGVESAMTRLAAGGSRRPRAGRGGSGDGASGPRPQPVNYSAMRPRPVHSQEKPQGKSS
jgi:type IV secretion system protein TrbL